MKYYVLGICGLVSTACYSQQPATASHSVVMVIGDDAPTTDTNEVHDFINRTPQTDIDGPQVRQKITPSKIEPTLENGFHLRFEIESPTTTSGIEKSDEAMFTSRLESNTVQSPTWDGKAVGKEKRRGASLGERSFNTKKRVKNWMPKFKKHYRPHACSEFY